MSWTTAALSMAMPSVTSAATGAQSLLLRDRVEIYGSRLLIALLVLGIALVLYSLVRYRGRIAGTLSWVVLVAGVAVLPLASVAFGSLLVFERAERVEFCGSCHLAMKAYVDDMVDPTSRSLAAIHFRNRYIPRNQCYNCHTSFGMFGTVKAKLAGIIDVHRYYTRSFHSPLSMREPYANTDCLKCHAGAVRWVAAHSEVADLILNGKVGCMSCHGHANPAHFTGG
jgi:nitrate/TMAO reductase-like tetraheme cytochrome c subunit